MELFLIWITCTYAIKCLSTQKARANSEPICEYIMKIIVYAHELRGDDELNNRVRIGGYFSTWLAEMPLKITGGHDTMVNEYPMMAALIDVKKVVPICGATIISDQYVLTAAHCFEDQDIGSIGLLVGDHNMSTGSDTPYSALYKLAGVRQHPDYDFTTLANDIAVVKVLNKMKTSLYVGPVCLPFRFTNADLVGQTVTVLGWGLTKLSGSYSDTLQEADLNVIDNDQCRAKISDRPITDKEICAYGPGKDACTGDSGGPLLWIDPTRHRSYLVGIISFGRGCGLHIPNVNTKVAEYLQWIEQTATGARFCYN